MEITKERAIVKIIFWQQIATIIFTLLLLLVWGLVAYGINLGLKYGYFEDYVIQNTCHIILCSLATYAVCLSYKSLSLLKSYQKNQDKLDLELAFKKQRHFWMMGPIMLILSMLTFILIVIFLQP
jgi:hypothetical protein